MILDEFCHCLVSLKKKKETRQWILLKIVTNNWPKNLGHNSHLKVLSLDIILHSETTATTRNIYKKDKLNLQTNNTEGHKY